MNEKTGLRDKLSLFWKALLLSFRMKSKVSICISVIGMLLGLFTLWSNILNADLINRITGLIQGEDVLRQALFTLLCIVLIEVLLLVHNMLKSYFVQYDSMRADEYIHDTTYDILSRTKYENIENNSNFMQKLDFINNQGWWRIAQLTVFVQNIVSAVISLAGIFVTLFYINPLIVLILFLSCLPGLWISKKYGNEAYFYELYSMREKWYIDYHAGLITGFNKEIRFFNLFGYIKNEWKTGVELLIKKRSGLTRKFTFYRIAADLIKNIAIVVSLYIVAVQIMENSALEVGTFVLVLTLASNIQTNMWTLLWSLGEFNTHSVYIKDFYAIRELECENHPESNETYDKLNIEFRNVSFTYKGTTECAIRNLNVTLRQGEKIAVVGENGSGKTTFIKLLSGIYDCDEGEILINGEPVKDIAKLRNSISVIFQDYAKYRTYIKENITVGDVNRTYTDDDIRDAARQTDIDSYIETLDDKYDTKLGCFSDSYIDLSGGQWQKLTLSRLLFKNDAKMMILDEPTASLDPLAEADIYANFFHLTKDKTAIFISHRLGITKVVDRILVFRDGTVAEQGTHDELIAANGVYADMYKSQAQWYK